MTSGLLKWRRTQEWLAAGAVVLVGAWAHAHEAAPPMDTPREDVPSPALKGSASPKTDPDKDVTANPQKEELPANLPPERALDSAETAKKKRKPAPPAPVVQPQGREQLPHPRKPDDAQLSRPDSSGTSSATLNAQLLEPEWHAERKSAVVEVMVRGVKLVDPVTVSERARKGQAHLQYRLDDGPVLATTTTRLFFQDLTSGTHEVLVRLAGNDGQPLGPEETLTFRIP